MLLRASGEHAGRPVDVRAVTDDGAAASSGIAHAETLLGYADAMVGDDDGALCAAAERVRDALGDAALVDAAAVASNFERMVRIADGTGIPLDAPMQALSEDLRSDLGLDAYGSAANTPSPGAVQRLVGPVVRRLAPLLLRARGALSRPRAR